MNLVPKTFHLPGEERRAADRHNVISGARAFRIDDLTDQVGVKFAKAQVAYETPAAEKRDVSWHFKPKQKEAIREVRYVEVTKVLVQDKKRWWNEVFESKKQGLDGGLVTDLPIRHAMLLQLLSGDGRVYVPARRNNSGATSPARRIRVAAENLHSILPEASSLDYLVK
ncbi:uncharacterized protein ColSpa_07933 [Colletotrichum spaethianum]|uniref:Uncharacterized protein n=1 Tax=Colletotrichum spaethianum TaxID=700344 RepID=A0AA37P8T5_9PEZI|nr:uncharacterized protein ColSpa_07933 [Colletotrichum spaethianum]GKT47752.1 hypothetical protein ColSpa_07933 [Colletotrichum spaethianum]